MTLPAEFETEVTECSVATEIICFQVFHQVKHEHFVFSCFCNTLTRLLWLPSKCQCVTVILLLAVTADYLI